MSIRGWLTKRDEVDTSTLRIMGAIIRIASKIEKTRGKLLAKSWVR